MAVPFSGGESGSWLVTLWYAMGHDSGRGGAGRGGAGPAGAAMVETAVRA
ncbi:MAG: hypothetical protein M3464_07440 [Chloroflexota bacterium]|nr:hypothetical protein [Chloroflexota bacterium]